jgi:hypothetical protein
MIMSVNVTALTKARLLEIVREGACRLVDVILLQETRHGNTGMQWAEKAIRKYGWCIAFSDSSLCEGRLVPGGTAIVWRIELGKSTALHQDGHRAVGRVFRDFAVNSVYGPAGNAADDEWMAQIVRNTEASGKDNVFAGGDYNWKPSYTDVLPADWISPATPPTVISGLAAPTRLCGRGARAEVNEAFPVTGVPHHKAVIYTVMYSIERETPQHRLTRCSVYEWQRDLTEEEQETLKGQVNEKFLQEGGIDLSTEQGINHHFTLWHSKAEFFMECAVRLGAAKCETKAERRRGTLPTMRRAERGPRHVEVQTVKLRRLLRLQRAAAEQERRGGGGSSLTTSQRRHWEIAYRDDIVKHFPDDQAQALEHLATMINAEWRRMAQELARRFRHKFMGDVQDTIQAAKCIVKPMAPQPKGTAAHMKDFWKPYWLPEDAVTKQAECENNWRTIADELGHLGEQSENAFPTHQVFAESLRGVRGAGGLDGWSRSDMAGLVKNAEWLIAELHGILHALSKYTVSNPDTLKDVRAIFAGMRVVGIPKPKSDDLRPIAVGSIMLRAWHGGIARTAPPPSSRQWCGRRGATVAAAIADWLFTRKQCGAELDLAKAFDTVWIRVATLAARRGGYDPDVCKYLEWAWTAPRWCQVAGELAEPIYPHRGLPPGDPLSPGVLDAVLAIWAKKLETLPGVLVHLYMDDRSVGADDQASLDAALAAGRELESAIGLEENCNKRQRWARGEDAVVEHLGATFLQSSDGCNQVVLRSGWDTVVERAKLVRMVPGGQPTRQAVMAIYVKPLWNWAPSLCGFPEIGVDKTVIAAVINSKCRWWCYWRWAVEHLQVVPSATVATRAVGGIQSYRDKFAPEIRHNALEALAWLESVLVDINDHTWIEYVGSEEQIKEEVAWAKAAQERRGIRGPEADRCQFAVNTAEGEHVLRQMARVRLLRRVAKSRLDSEGIEDVDVQHLSHLSWKKWKAGLSKENLSWLNVWRGGAVKTNTRGKKVGVQDDSIACAHCGAERGSARHLWAECPKYAQLRADLETEHGIENRWWSAQPRCTSKSGWVVRSCGTTRAERAKCAIAACTLGIAIARDGKED